MDDYQIQEGDLLQVAKNKFMIQKNDKLLPIEGFVSTEGYFLGEDPITKEQIKIYHVVKICIKRENK